MKAVKLSVLRTGRLYPRKYSWYPFLLDHELTPGPQCDLANFRVKAAECVSARPFICSSNCMVQCLSWKADSYSAGTRRPAFKQWKFRHDLENCPLQDPKLSHYNPLHFGLFSLRHDDKGNDDYEYYIIYLLKYLMSQSQLQADTRNNNNNNNKHLHLMQKVKEPQYRPGQALSFPVVRGAKMSKQSLHEGGKVVTSRSAAHKLSLN